MIVLSKRKLDLALCIAAALASCAPGLAAEGDSTTTGVHTRGAPHPIPLFPSPASAGTTLAVTSCADDGSPGTLRSVVASAVDGDTVDLTQLTCGTITLLSGQIDIGIDNVTIEGPGADTLAVDANQAANTGYIQNGRAFYHTGAGTLTVNSLTVTQGLVNYYNAYGGCIFSNGNVTLNDAVVSGCRALTYNGGEVRGGGIYASSHITLNRATVSDNQAIAHGRSAHFASGGGVFASSGGMTVIDSLITRNRSEASYATTTYDHTQASGGGISSYFGGLTISNSIISDNFTGCDTDVNYCRGAVGGGIRSVNGLTLAGSRVSGNVVRGEGRTVALGGPVLGGSMEIESNDAEIYISYSTIENNHVLGGQYVEYSPVFGGGVVTSAVSIDIASTTIDGNTSEYGAGGMWNARGLLTIENSTISANEADFIAGGILINNFLGTNLSLSNSTVTLNVSRGNMGGGGIVDRESYYTDSFQSSIVAGNIVTADTPLYDADLGVASGAIEGANNLIVAANGVTLPPDTISADPMLGPLQDNGGPTLTHALLPSSPAIDTGNNAANLSWDQRGDGYPRVVGVSADIGALEYSATDDQPPIAANDTYATAQDTTLTVNVPGVLANDSDPNGDSLTAVLVTGPSNGTLTLNTDGSFVYVPAAGFFGTDSFTYEANDGQLHSNAATVAIQVSRVDQPPIAADDSYTTAENTTLTVDAPGVLGNDSDPDGDTLTAVLVNDPSNGALSLSPDGSFVYVPAAGFSGTDSFTYEANDGQASSAPATVTITVTQGSADTIFADGFDGASP